MATTCSISVSGTRTMAAWARSTAPNTSWSLCSRRATPHTSTTSSLAQGGRYRTNVWDYAGVNSFSGRSDLEMHPTVKPVALISDAIRDCSKRNGIVFDPFGGSGSTLIAAEKVKRRARLMELDPHYCDTIVTRWQKLTKQDAIDGPLGITFTGWSEGSRH